MRVLAANATVARHVKTAGLSVPKLAAAGAVAQVRRFSPGESVGDTTFDGSGGSFGAVTLATVHCG